MYAAGTRRTFFPMADTITGSTIADRYRITGLLRAGRMGDIYVARRADDGRRVCVKLLDPGLFHNDEAVKRFARESKVTRRIDHPCSMRVLDFGTSNHGPFLVMEYVDGEVLDDIVTDGPIDPMRAAGIAGRIAMALQAAHSEGIIHRDLAPTNVLVAEQAGVDIVKVTDFGLSLLTDSAADATETNLTAVGVRIGTPTYMAPEYIEEYELDHRADIYGLGVMLYEMLVGEPPYTGRPYKVMDAHVNAPIPKPSERVPEVPSWLDDLVLHLMAKQPSQRPSQAQQVVEAIEKGMGRPLQVAEYRSESAPPAPTRTRAPEPRQAPATDPILVRFIEQNLGKVSRERRGEVDRKRCFVVSDVARTSIAAQVGVTPGWLVQLDGTSGLLDTALHREVVDQRTYRFYPPDSDEVVVLQTSGVPIGVRLRRSVENVAAHYDPLQPDPSALLDLWHQGAWEELKEQSWRTLTKQRGAAGLLNTGLFAKFLGSDKVKLHDHPALLFHGAARVELGEGTAGMAEIIDYKAQYAAHWPQLYDAVAHYYAARDKLRTGATEVALDLLRQAHVLAPLKQVASLYHQTTGEELDTTPWVGQTFTDYSMDELDTGHSARLSEVCGQMDGSQLLGICMMGGFRGSPDYNEFMHRFANFAAFFPGFLIGLHVVTTATKRDVDHPEHYEGEDLARTAGVNLMCLHDYRAFVQRAVKPGKVPMVYLITKYGTCVHEGRLDEVDLWDALALSGRLRVQNLHG
jgi:serine/threonine protein kinase